ncbi:MAG TPA: hypothetical protein VND64_18865 [Pirellulales bacterium]|nr:hypothetical protein [Pirellulales bacterium]
MANERFSGKGHARHVCRECSRLGGDELARRQAMRNLERCFSSDGKIRRRCRRPFQQFLDHADPVVRDLAEQYLADSIAEFADGDQIEWHCSDDDDLVGVWIENDPTIEEWESIPRDS